MCDDKPVHRPAESIGDLWRCVTHPAFRIGFLDAMCGRQFDHDHIMSRISSETPARALERCGWSNVDLFQSGTVELAQYRYEEGRKLFKEYGIRCRAWGHPDFPPAQVRTFLVIRAGELQAPGEAV